MFFLSLFLQLTNRDRFPCENIYISTKNIPDKKLGLPTGKHSHTYVFVNRKKIDLKL